MQFDMNLLSDELLPFRALAWCGSESLLALARHWYRNGRTVTARRTLQVLLKKYPNTPQVPEAKELLRRLDP